MRVLTQRDGSVVQLRVDLRIDYSETTLLFDLDTEDQLAAKLLVEKLRTEFEELAQAIRKQAYDAGWRDAKSRKRPKRRHFSTVFQRTGE